MDFFVYSYSRTAYLYYGGVHFVWFSRPLSAQWRHVASFRCCPPPRPVSEEKKKGEVGAKGNDKGNA